MRVALDCRTLQEQPLGGIGRALIGVIPHLMNRVELRLLMAAESRKDLALGLPEVALPTPWPGLSAGWLQFSAPRWLHGFDGIFHCPFYGLPFVQSVPMVVSIHDLTFERRPEWFRRDQRLAFRAQARWAARTARVILTPSHHVASQLTSTYGVDPVRIVVAPPALDPVFQPAAASEEVLSRLGISPPYLVALGGAPRRNVDLALAAWRGLRDRHELGLVVAGPRLPAEPGLWSGRLPDADWAAVLAGATALLYPTSDEGFGLPALEAMASGTPVICAPVGSLPEVLGREIGVWASTTKVPDLIEAAQRLLAEPSLAVDVQQAGLLRANGWLSWEESAERYFEAYARASNGR